MGRGVPAIAAAILAAGASAQAQEPVDIELVLAIDMSISVNNAEFLLQRQGFAAAFRDPAVIEAISANAQGVAVSMVAWAGVDQQSTVIDWRLLTDASSSLRFATAIERELIIDPEFSGKTAIGNAISYSLRTLDHNGYSGTRRKIDVSGDGHANEGLKPDRARDYAVHSGVTVNGLAILNDEPYLEDYYRKHVIGGSGAFVMVAADYRDFADAIRRKLLRELSPVETAGRGKTTLAGQ